MISLKPIDKGKYHNTRKIKIHTFKCEHLCRERNKFKYTNLNDNIF